MKGKITPVVMAGGQGRPEPLAVSNAYLYLVALAVALSLLLRAVGLGWGLPSPRRSYPYHPDEPVLALAALQVDFAALQLSPRFYNYGSLSIYLDRLAMDAAVGAGWIQLPRSPAGGLAPVLGALIRVGRWITVLMGVLTVAATAGLGASLFGPRAGALAAALLAVAPLHLTQGHYSTVDVPATLWTTLCLLLCARALQKPDRGALALAGMCAGLAASTKYNAGLVLLAPLFTLAATWRRGEWYASDRAAALVYTPVAAALAFVLTTPGVLIDSRTFAHDFLYELHHSASGHGRVFAHTLPAWLFHLTRSLPEGLGIPLTLAAAGGVGWAVARHTPEDGLLLAFTLPYYLLLSGAQVKFARYLVPILPVLVILAARLLTEPWGPEWTHHGDTETWRKIGRRLGGCNTQVEHRILCICRALALAVVVLWTAAYGVAMAAVFNRPDPREQAAGWIQRALRPGERVGLAGEPWFYTPPLTPALGCTHVLEQACGQTAPAWIVAPRPGEGALSLVDLARSKPQYVIASEFEYLDPLRLRAEAGYTDGTTALIDALQARYQLVLTCRNRPSLGPLRWFTRNAPVHDLMYPMPDVRIYRRRGQ